MRASLGPLAGVATATLLLVACTSSPAPTSTQAPVGGQQPPPPSAAVSSPVASPAASPSAPTISPVPSVQLAPSPSAAAVAAAKPTPKNPPVRLTVAIPQLNLNYIVPLLAQQKGFFLDEGIDLDIQPMQASLIVASMAHGDLEISGAGGSTLRAALQGQPFKLITFLTARPTLLLMTNSNVQSPDQLAGKKIGVTNTGDSESQFVDEYAQQQGLDPNQIVFVTMGADDATRLAAMQSGALDGATLDPAGAALAEQQGAHILQDLGQVVPEPFQGFVTTQSEIDDHSDDTVAFLRAMVRGLLYAKQHPDEAAQLAQQKLGLDMDDATALRSVQLYLDEVSASAPGYADPDQRDTFLEYDIKQPLNMPEDQPVSVNLFDFGPLLQAYDQLGIPRPSGATS